MTVASSTVKKKITAGFEAGGYLFLLQTSTTNAIMVTIIVIRITKSCNVKYIVITSPFLDREGNSE